MKFANIESLWAYAKKKLPNAAQISTVQKTGSSKFFDITIPKSLVKKFPADASGDLEYSVNEVSGDIEMFLENNGSTATIATSKDFYEAVLVYLGINESMNENTEAFFRIDNHNYDGYGISDDVYQTMCRITNSNEFWFTNRFDAQNQELPEIAKIMTAVEGSKFIVTKFDNCSEVHIYNIGNNKLLVIEPGNSAFSEKLYLSTELYNSLNVNENMNEAGLTMKIRPLSPKMMGDFEPAEIKYIQDFLGSKTIYQVTERNKYFKEINKKINSKYLENNKLIAGFRYWCYVLPAGDKIMKMESFYGDSAYLLGSNKLNENAIIGIEDSSLHGWDKEIQFEYSGARKDLAKQLDKLKKPYQLDVLPSQEVNLYVKNADVNVFKGFIQTLHESWMPERPAANIEVPEAKVLTQAEFRAQFGGSGNTGSYMLRTMYNPKLIVACDSNMKGYAEAKAFAETHRELPLTGEPMPMKAYRQTDSNIFIVANNAVYWPYNSGTNFVLNEGDLMKSTGKIYVTNTERGVLSDEALKVALQTLSGQMSELSTDPAEESIKAYKECEDEYQCLINELNKRGLKL